MCAALKPVYQAANEEAALEALAAFEASELGRRYPAAIKTFTDAWDRFTPFLAFPPMLRRVISPPLRGRYPPPRTRSSR
ncbi:transposase [Actinomyces oricola]